MSSRCARGDIRSINPKLRPMLANVMKPWHEEPSLPTNLAEDCYWEYLCFRGWSEGIWYDGPLVVGRGNRLIASIPQGVDTVLSWNCNSPGVLPPEHWAETLWSPGLALLSLKEALRQMPKPGGELCFSLPQRPTTAHLVTIYLIGATYSRKPDLWCSLPCDLSLQSQIKRMLENCGIETTARRLANFSPCNLTRGLRHIPALIHEINAWGDVIPASLIRQLSQDEKARNFAEDFNIINNAH